MRPQADRPQRQTSRNATISAACTVLLATVGLAIFSSDLVASTVALLVGALWCIVLVLALRVLRLGPFSPALIYFYLLGLVHLGMVVPWALDVRLSNYPDWLITHELRPALGLVAIAVASYHAGASAAAWLWPPEQPRDPKPRFQYHNTALVSIGLAIVAAGLMAFAVGLYALGFERLLHSDYGDTYELASRYDPRFFATSMTLVPVGLYLTASAARRRLLPWTVGLSAIWGGCILFLGFRGYALVPAVTVFAVLHKRGLRLPRFVYVAGIIALLLMIPAVRSTRADPVAGRTVSLSSPLRAPLAAIEEMGGTLRAVVHTVEFLENEPFRWGGTYWYALQSVVPNLSLDWQGGEYLPLERLPPSHWLTLQAAPHTYRAFGGLGFSAIAEPYMNFGVFGVMAYFFLLALALVALYQFDDGRPTRLAAWAVLLGPLLWTVRNDFHGLFRPLILGLVAITTARLVANSWPIPARLGGWVRRSQRTADAFRAPGVRSISPPGQRAAGPRVSPT